MAPFAVLVVLFATLAVLGHWSIPYAFGWTTALRLALAGMFLLTASAHWGRRRPDLIRMVPPALPHPDLLVTVTGVAEVAGACGLLMPATARYAAFGLCLLLVAVLPANVRAAQEHLTIGGRPVPTLWPRIVLQIVFIAATVTIFITGG